MLEASQYQAGQLHNLLGDLQSERVSGFVYIDTTVKLNPIVAVALERSPFPIALLVLSL
jgi:hypothetical protein